MCLNETKEKRFYDGVQFDLFQKPNKSRRRWIPQYTPIQDVFLLEIANKGMKCAFFFICTGFKSNKFMRKQNVEISTPFIPCWQCISRGYLDSSLFLCVNRVFLGTLPLLIVHSSIVAFIFCKHDLPRLA